MQRWGSRALLFYKWVPAGQRGLATAVEGSEQGTKRFNQVGVQLVSEHVSKQLFGTGKARQPDDRIVDISLGHLSSHNLTAERRAPTSRHVPSVSFDLPALQGDDIRQHFHNIGLQEAQPYLDLAKRFADIDLPPIPTYWADQAGWTKYFADGTFESVPYPDLDADSQALCFDVETLYKQTKFSCMATAASSKHWYSWLSPWLLGLDEKPEQLIPLPSTAASPRLIVGHNISYDRARLAQEYSLARTYSRFLDTMSLHVAVSGLSSPQRPAWIAYRKNKLAKAAISPGQAAIEQIDEVTSTAWQDASSMNSLAEVARLHCGIEVDKSQRDAFGVLDRHEVVNELQELLSYCANDVRVTHQVYRVVFPAFLQACPSPVSLAGVLQMSTSFLPVDKTWNAFIDSAESVYQDLKSGVSKALQSLAVKAKSMMQTDSKGQSVAAAWKNDPWLAQLDWNQKNARKDAIPIVDTNAAEEDEKAPPPATPAGPIPSTFSELSHAEKQLVLPLLYKFTWRSFPVRYHPDHGWLIRIEPGSLKRIVESKFQPKIQPSPFPADKKTVRYIQILLAQETKKDKDCEPIHDLLSNDCLSIGPDWLDPQNFSPDVSQAEELWQQYIALSQDACDNDVWLSQIAFVRSARALSNPGEETETTVSAIKSARKQEPKWYWDLVGKYRNSETNDLDLTVRSRVAPLLLKLTWYGQPIFWSKEHAWVFRVPFEYEPSDYGLSSGIVPLEFSMDKDDSLKNDSHYHFFKLPHHDGGDANVGSPLSKGFLGAFEDGRLGSHEPGAAEALEMNAQCSYWVAARERIIGQMVVTETVAPNLPKDTGLILPQVVTMGTVTRRAVENTWLTASNAKKNRVGSELRSLVRAPAGYAIVGADVDSEELWICSVMGDSYFGIHGATAIGWMTLEGSKNAGTDVHSTTAKILGISRDGAKVFNYSRLYGAGVNHAIDLLQKSNPRLTREEASETAKRLYANTKGTKLYRPRGKIDRKYWYGGSESYVFNMLESIAGSEDPRTPALKCTVTQALQAKRYPVTTSYAIGKRGSKVSKAGKDDTAEALPSDYLPSRINWVVQSSGVDYLHLLIVAIEYLLKKYSISARYMISLHDEIRYLAKEEDKYRLALAMQVANIWVRALFAHELGMDDLPESCAYFSAVDIDHIFRKEVTMDCITPSNKIALPPGEALDIHQILAKTAGTLRADGQAIPSSYPSSTSTLQPVEVDIDFLIAQAVKA